MLSCAPGSCSAAVCVWPKSPSAHSPLLFAAAQSYCRAPPCQHVAVYYGLAAARLASSVVTAAWRRSQQKESSAGAGGGSSGELGSGESKAGSSSSKEGSDDKQGGGSKDGSGGREGREDSGGNDSPPIPDTSEFGFSWTELYEVRDELMAWKERVVVEWAAHAHRAPRLAACSLRAKGWPTTMFERRLVCWQHGCCDEVAKVGRNLQGCCHRRSHNTALAAPFLLPRS